MMSLYYRQPCIKKFVQINKCDRFLSRNIVRNVLCCISMQKYKLHLYAQFLFCIRTRACLGLCLTRASLT